ncbi:AraC family transcriptional regulator [Aequorivita echinoideorum]|uniref:AraC family transcriptional regulator n=1 Tax=Aequorivita echinoideorum TaxID=1549647 RepID=A0ABS5S2N1_9FLAO|nr:AraC family transcriptional regulator [Aequorivita echinoideorum]MBT0607453.1 AraC family transcriptional regulator [Aequorivita echinoideorum]
MEHSLRNHRESRKIYTLVENRTTYNAEYAELNIFETHKAAERVSLTFDFPVIASMLTGKKIMHLKYLPDFEFLPGESVVMPANEEMVIDFPIATQASPTQCLALGIDPGKISEVALKFNEQINFEEENNNWNLEKGTASHLTNQVEVNYLIERLVSTFTHNSASKDALLDLMIQELIIRLLQTKAKQSILNDTLDIFSDTRIGSVVKYIKENLTDRSINVEQLAEKAYMSSSSFHKKFKNTLGISPVDFMNSEKIKFAKKLMKENKNMLISEIAFKSGFNNVSYFNRQFKKLELMTPQQFIYSFRK